MYETDKKSILKANKAKALKKDKLRYVEYYDLQPTFDNLYKQSQQGFSFKHLYNLISSKENILLAYRMIKRNSGSKTAGTNHHTIKHLEKMSVDEFINYFQGRLANFLPQKVRRIEIPKPNGKMRPLGIPCIEDRIIQQCMKQILEPICEAKFHPHSYGFRANRSTSHAIAYMYKKINLDKCYYIVDVDIKGFFDNVNHGKLMKQLWTIGIQDKKVLSIIGKMLKAEIEGEGIPMKGIPQGGILSPLLANVVLNEMDWWLSNQWQTYHTNRPDWNYVGNKYRHLRLSNLKEIYSVRYADDFKIFCKDYQTAEKIFHATQQWLFERLGLEISKEKSEITNVTKKSSEFLGFKIKAIRKGKKYVVKSDMCDKAIQKAKDTIREQVNYISKHSTHTGVYVLNKIIAGIQNYYRIATNVVQDFREIHYSLINCYKQRFKKCETKRGYKSKEYLQRYEHYGGKTIYVCKTALYPVRCINTKPPSVMNQEVTNYTAEGRRKIHTKLGCIDLSMLNYLARNPDKNASVEYNDNRLSLYSAQKGKCLISKEPLDLSMEVHHIKPVSQGGGDFYQNLILVTSTVHKLIHITDVNKILFYLSISKLNHKALRKINKYRCLLGNKSIEF